MGGIDSIIAAQAADDQPGATFRAIDRALAETPGTILFTILVRHAALKQNERFYTNMPVEYPVGGCKPITDTAWSRRLFDEGLPYIGYTRADIAEVFFDHELIWSLGCESVLNMPVRWAGQTLGTFNLLHRAGHYNEGHVAQVRLIAQLALPGLLGIARS